MLRLILCFLLLLLPGTASAMGANNAGPANKTYSVRFLSHANTGAIFSIDSNSTIVNPGFEGTRKFTQMQPPKKLGCSINYKNRHNTWTYARVVMQPQWPAHGKLRLRQSGHVPEGTHPVDAGLVCELIDDETGVRIDSGVIKR